MSDKSKSTYGDDILILLIRLDEFGMLAIELLPAILAANPCTAARASKRACVGETFFLPK
jgi:hypothetical protein